MASKQKIVHGDDLLYRFFQSLMADRPELAVDILRRMYTSMGIWLPIEVYRKFPVLLPWVVRDPSCRGSKSKGLPDQWGAPDESGYQRDDNSLIKAIPRTLEVNGAALAHVHGARMGTEFVASHIWRVIKDTRLASRHPLLNSFVPNLVWLPSQVAKLTDREGEVMQQVLQALAWKTYRHVEVEPSLSGVVEEAWSLIPEPEASIAETGDLNTFAVTSKFFQTRKSRLDAVLEALQELECGETPSGTVLSTRYREGLPGVSAGARTALLKHLERFIP